MDTENMTERELTILGERDCHRQAQEAYDRAMAEFQLDLELGRLSYEAASSRLEQLQMMVDTLVDIERGIKEMEGGRRTEGK